jgi:hypothetical protein
MHEFDEAALERRLRSVLREHLGSLPLDITVEDLERRREVRDAARRRHRGLVVLGLAAALLVPLGLLAGGGRPLREAVMVPDTSASPAATATSEASPLGAWVAKLPDNWSFGTGSGSTTMTLEVGPTTRVRVSGTLVGLAMFESSMTVAADHQVRLVITSVTPIGEGAGSGTPVAIFDNLWLAGCKLGDVGLYTWSISADGALADGALLTLASDGDACPSREAVLARTWKAHEIPFGVWAAPNDLPFYHQRLAGEKMVLDLGYSAVVSLPLSYPETGWYDSTVTRAGDYWEFTSIAGTDWPVHDGYLPAGCNLGDLGRYVLSLSADGSQLTLASVGDACPSREAVLARTWGFLAPP